MLHDYLKSTIEDGLAVDILRAEQSFLVLTVIGDNASRINQLDFGSFSSLFYLIQNALQTEILISTARIYDTPSKKYPTRCIKGLLNFLKENKDELPLSEIILSADSDLMSKQEKLMWQKKAEDRLLLFGLHKDDINSILHGQSSLSQIIFDHLESIFVNPKMLELIAQLKEVRDKKIAHNEETKNASSINWGDVKYLIDKAKVLVGFVGWVYCDAEFFNDEQYLISRDLKIEQAAMECLIERLMLS